jgi:phage terminase small subunit
MARKPTLRKPTLRQRKRTPKLTPRMRKFVEIYLSNGRNATYAHRSAYATGGKPENATKDGYRLLKHPAVAEMIAKADAKAVAATEKAIDQYVVSVERITRELALIGFSNMADYMTAGPDGDPVLDFSKLTRDQAAALSEVTVEDFKDGRGETARDVRRVKFKLADKRAALVDLGRTFAMFKDRQELTGVGGGPIVSIYLPGNDRDGITPAAGSSGEIPRKPG